MPELTSKRINLLSTAFLIMVVFFRLYKENLFPFSALIPLELSEKGRLATTNFFSLEPTQYTHETYYPRLFLTPFFILYRLFNFQIGIIQFMMFFTLVVSLVLSAYIISEKLNGQSIGLILVTYQIVNGNFSNVIGIFFLLYLIEKPTSMRALILGLGYFPLLLFVLPYLYQKKKYLFHFSAAILLIHLILFRPNQSFGLFWTGFNSWIIGFSLFTFASIELVFLITFIWLMITKKETFKSPYLILPITTLIIVAFLILVRFNFYWIVKSLILFPVFVSIIPWNNHFSPNSKKEIVEHFLPGANKIVKHEK